MRGWGHGVAHGTMPEALHTPKDCMLPVALAETLRTTFVALPQDPTKLL